MSMTNVNVDDLAQIIRQVDGNHDLGAGALAEAILGHLPAPQVVRTVKELWSMDLETLLYCGWRECHYILAKDLHPDHLPAVVLVPAAQVRAARKALEES